MTSRPADTESEALAAALRAFGVEEVWDCLPEADRTVARDFIAGSDAARRARVVAQSLSTGRRIDQSGLDRSWRSWQSAKSRREGGETVPTDHTAPVGTAPVETEASLFTVFCETAWDPPRRRRSLWRWLETIDTLVAVANDGMVRQLEPEIQAGEPKWRVVLIDDAGHRLTESQWSRSWSAAELLQREWQERTATSEPADVYATAHMWRGSVHPRGLIRPLGR